MYMKKMKLKSLFITFFIVLLLGVTLLSGCVTITAPKTPISPPASSTPKPTPTAINPEWTPPATTNQNTKPLPSIADVVALVKPSVVAINTEVVSYDLFNRPYTQ